MIINTKSVNFVNYIAGAPGTAQTMDWCPSQLGQCVKDMRGLIGLCSLRLQGQDPGMSLILGLSSNTPPAGMSRIMGRGAIISFVKSLSNCPFTPDDEVLQRLQSGDTSSQLAAAQALIADVKKLRDMANDAFTDDREFNNCVQQ
jgi:hypothetical protein